MNNYVTYNDLRDISNRIVSSGKDVDVLLPVLVITTDYPDCTITAKLGDTVLTASYDGTDYRIVLTAYGDWTVTCSKEINGVMRSRSKVVNVSVVQIYELRINPILIYGYRIKDAESDPDARVEYIYDSVGMKPAKMNFSTGVFDYGDWKDAWFVKENKPCMLKYDGTVDYYLDPDDYTKKVDGTPSDVADTTYDGNAMSEIPLVWVKRYEDSGYKYELISDVQVSSDYKAYAHIRPDNSIADCFYWSIFGGCVITGADGVTRLRSISGRGISYNTSIMNFKLYARNNGTTWDIHPWGGRELLRTLLFLMCKSTNSQESFGYGPVRSKPGPSTGTLNTKGQFWGSSDGSSNVKVFHIEQLWGNIWDALMGLVTMGSDNKVHASMMPLRTNPSDYLDTGIIGKSVSFTWWENGKLSELGLIPTTWGGSSSTFFTDCAQSYVASSDNLVWLAGSGNQGTPVTAGLTAYSGQRSAAAAADLGAGIFCIS